MDNHKLHTVLQDQATEQDAIDVAQWLGTAQGQLVASDMIDADMDALAPLYVPVCSDNNVRPLHKIKSLWWKVAALVAIVLSLGTFVWVNHPVEQVAEQPEPTMQMICANRGEQVHVVLQDGTHIYLNADSRLVFPNRFTDHQRKVSLTGEAYFEVEKDAHSPFVVDLNGAQITVLGTQFNVKAYENEQLQVSLDEGHVVFADVQQQVDMHPGEQLRYDRTTCQSTLINNANTQMASAWREHRLEVSEMPMRELLAMLERQYNVHFDVRDEKCYDYCFSLAVSDDNLRTALKRMTYVSPIRYHYDEEAQYVSIRMNE